ncbi:hypothetical protein [Microbacterium sp. NPDC055683]
MSDRTTTPDDRPAVHLRADSLRAQRLVVGLLLALSAAAFLCALPGLIWLGEVAGLGVLAFAVPAVVDLGQVVMALATAVARSSGRNSRWEGLTLTALVILSSAAQVLHVTAVADTGQPLAHTVMAAALAAAMPLSVLAGTHAVVHATLAPAVRRPTRASKRAATVSAATTTTKSATPAPVTPAKAVDRPAARPRPVVAAAPAEVTMTIEAAAREVVVGRMSGRAAALAAGVSRHRMTALVAELTTAEAA